MFAPVDRPFSVIASLLGASKDDLKLVFCVIISYPLAGILKRLPDAKPWKKNVFLITVSLFFLVGIFDLWGGLRTLFISSAGAYIIAACTDGSYMPWIGFTFLMGHMLISHIFRELYPNPGIMDVTGAQMVLVMKLTAFCWSVHDGRLPDEELSEFQKGRKIVCLPNILDYAAYVLFFPALFAGPAFDYREYERWIDGTMFDIVIRDPKYAEKRHVRHIPSSHIPAIRKGVLGLFFIVAFARLSATYTTNAMLQDTFMQYSLLRRVWYIYVFSIVMRLKYYGIWMLSDGACILSGLGYNGLDQNGRQRWDRLTNINPWGLETAQSSRAYLENWNVNTNKWLRNYVYLRVTPKNKKPGFRSSMATFGTSALWHGISPGYYLSFVSASFIQTVAKNFRRYMRPIFLAVDEYSPSPYKKFYDFAGFLVTQLIFSYITIPFTVLGLMDSVRIWSRLYFYGHIGVVLASVFFKSPAKAWLVAYQHRRAKTGPHRSISGEAFHRDAVGPMGLPENPEADLKELKAELETTKSVQRKRYSPDEPHFKIEPTR